MPVAVSWTAAAVLHAGNAWFADGGTATRVIAAALVVAAVAGVPVLLLAGGQRSLLLAAVAGAVGVASWVLPLLVPGLGPARWDAWVFAAALFDGLTVRLAVFALRRAERAAHRPA